MIYPKHIVAAGVFVKNKDKKFLLVKTERRGWELPGGQVEQGEDIISGLIREVREESGARMQIKKLAAIYSSLSEPSKVIFDFVGEYNGGDGVIKTTGEIIEIGWFSAERIIPNIQNEIMKYRIEWLLKNNNDKMRISSYYKNPFKILSELEF